MQDRSQSKKNTLVGPVLPVPVSPFWSWYDTWLPDTVSSKTWAVTIPKDGMLYKLCNFTHITLPQGFLAGAIYKNGAIIWYQYEGFMQAWNPASEQAPMFEYPDVLEVTLLHLYNYEWRHYWQIDFWREPKH